MAAATSSGTSFSSISQEKKLSPASPDQSVPSQSKAAKRGSSRRTDSTKAWALSATTDEDTVFPGTFYFRTGLQRATRSWVPGRELIVMDADGGAESGFKNKSL